MEPLNRVALIVRPKRRYKEWADSVAAGDDDSIFDLDEARLAPAVYLVAPPADLSLSELIDEYAADIFDEQLEAWHTDESQWPVNRSPHVFRDWFDVTVTEPVVDLDPSESLDVDEDDEGLLDVLRGTPGAMTSCAWCEKPMDGETPMQVVNLKGARDSRPEAELIELTLGARAIQAVVPGDDSPAAREGVAAFVVVCSDECGRSFEEAWNHQDGALPS